MHRPAQRLTRILVCAAAVPVILVASGCSSGPDDDAKPPASKPSKDAASSAKEAEFKTLPDPCETLSAKTLGALVPKPESKAGEAGKSDDIAKRGTCSWSSLDNKGIKGSQFRWLNVSLLRFESDNTRGTGDKQAGQYYDKQLAGAQATEGATGATTVPVSDTGDQASAVTYSLKKKEGSFKQQTVVARVQNVVVTVDYNGAGLAGEKTPDADKLLKDAEHAAREAVDAVLAANGSGGASGSGSASPSGKPAPSSPSSSASAKDS